MIKIRSLTISLGVALTIVCIMLGNLLYTVNSISRKTTEVINPAHHIQVLAQNSDEYFWKKFKEGATKAGTDLNVYVEFVDVDKRDANSTVEAINRGVWSNVDGMALQLTEYSKTKTALDYASSKKVPMLTYENDAFDIPGYISVGSNSYDSGYMEGTMCANACNGEGDIAIIINEAENKDSSNKNLKLQGILNSLAQYSKIKINKIYSLNTEMFETEKITTEIIQNSPGVNVIICTDEKNTPGIAQIIVDKSKVGKIQVIGYGSMPQTLTYIQRGVIYGTVCPDPFEIGYKTVSQLIALIDKENPSEVTNTSISSVTQKNVDNFIDKSDESKAKQ